MNKLYEPDAESMETDRVRDTESVPDLTEADLVSATIDDSIEAELEALERELSGQDG